jgi:ferredoxin
MPRLTIDNKSVQVPEGATILDAARKLGIDIPTMCFLEGCNPSTSCMVCVVKLNDSPTLVPSCAMPAAEGMRVETDTEEIRNARKTALELLLSDHVGDCMAPCHVICPAKMNIPLMLRQIAAGKLSDAIITVKRDIALPAILGRICPAPCEKGCRRGTLDQPVSICLLKRYVADIDLASDQPHLPPCEPTKYKKVAIVGAGPAGLAAAWRLLQKGFACTIFDDHDAPGGMLRFGLSETELPRNVIDAEVALIEKLGASFRYRTKIGKDLSLETLRKDFDAVFLATGQGSAQQWAEDDTFEIDSATYATSLPGVFAAGGIIRKQRLAVRAVADGKEAAYSIDCFLSNQPVSAPEKPFNHRMGKLLDGEIELFATHAQNKGPAETLKESEGFTPDQAVSESQRCLHCDCRKPDCCKLRQYAQKYTASSNTYKAPRRPFAIADSHPDIIYEPGKCIRCGLCIQIAAQAKEELGLTFIGRGFNVKVAPPFDRSIAEALQRTAQKCAAACPTAALAPRDALS